MSLLALSTRLEVPRRVSVTPTLEAKLMAAVVALVNDNELNFKEKADELYIVREPLLEVPETMYGTLAKVELTVTSAPLFVTVTPSLANGLTMVTLEPL